MRSHPYLTIWNKPRQTMEGLKKDPNRGLFVLSAISGFLMNVNMAQVYGLIGKMGFWWMVLLAILLSPVTGYLYLSLASFFVFIAGKWMGGKAAYKRCRSALAWSCFPLIANVLMWFLLLGVIGEKLFFQTDGLLLTSPQIIFVFAISLAQVVFSVWSLIVFFYALAQVQEMSVLKAVGNAVLAMVLFMVLFILLWFLAVLLWAHLF